MEKRRKNLIVGFSFIVGIILIIAYDSFQQHYYLGAFGLWPNGESIPVINLMGRHAFVWILWTLSCLPLFLIYSRIKQKINSEEIAVLGLSCLTILGFTVLVTIMAATYEVYQSGDDLSLLNIQELFIFRAIQKSNLFCLAYALFLMSVNYFLKQAELSAKVEELYELSYSIDSLKAELQKSNQNGNRALNVKVGGDIKIVKLDDISCVESYDYYVKIHTKEGLLLARETMKNMESKLPNNFVRVHRTAIINLNYLTDISVKNFQANLTNGFSVPITRKKMGELKLKVESMYE